MTPVVVFPDTAALVVQYLEDALAAHGQSVPVRTAVPNPRPDNFVTIRKTGGQRPSIVVDAPQLTVAGWGAMDEQASDLAELCRALIYALAGTTQNGVPVYKVTELADPADFQDISDHPQFRFTVQVHVRGAAA